jgi:hypothetical protein
MPKRNGFQTERPGSPGSLGAVGFEQRGAGQGDESMNQLDREEGGRIDQLIQRNPMSSVLTGFGLGFGFGLMVTLLISRQRQQTWFERAIPETIQHLPERFKRVPETWASYVPDSWKRS